MKTNEHESFDLFSFQGGRKGNPHCGSMGEIFVAGRWGRAIADRWGDPHCGLVRGILIAGEWGERWGRWGGRGTIPQIWKPKLAGQIAKPQSGRLQARMQSGQITSGYAGKCRDVRQHVKIPKQIQTGVHQIRYTPSNVRLHQIQMCSPGPGPGPLRAAGPRLPGRAIWEREPVPEDRR